MAGTPEPPLAVQNQPPVEPVAEVEKPSKNYWKMATGILVLLLILCGIVLGYLLMKKLAVYPNTQTANPAVQPTLTPTTTITDETANWKTYSYSFFSLKLPNDWKVYNESNPTQFANYNLNSAPGRDYSPQLDKGKLKVEIYESAIGDTLRHYVDLQKQQSSSWLETDTKVSGLPAVRVKTNSPGFVIYTQSATSEKIISIVFALDFDNNQGLANQILSTFKFTDNTQVSTQNNWPQYSESLADTRFAFASPYGKPITTLTSLDDYKKGGIFVLGAADNPFFQLNDLKVCNAQMTDVNICLIPGKNWGQTDDKEAILVDGNHAVSVYLYEPKTNSVLRVVQFTQGFPIQLSMAVDGVGADGNFKLILQSFKFVE